MDFPRFVEAISEVALRGNRQQHQAVTAVLSLNKEGFMRIRHDDASHELSKTTAV